MHSKQKGAVSIQKWINKEVLPALFRFGTYVIIALIILLFDIINRIGITLEFKFFNTYINN